MSKSLIAIWLGSLLVIGAGFYYVGSNQKTLQNENPSGDQIQAMQNQLASTTAELESIETASAIKETTTANNENLDNILLSYKVDAQDGSDLRDSLMNAAYNTPTKICPAIVGSRTTRNNIYYLVLDNNYELETKYGEYRSRIAYIGNNLRTLDQSIQIVKDKCEAVGYQI